MHSRSEWSFIYFMTLHNVVQSHFNDIVNAGFTLVDRNVSYVNS